MKDLDIEKILNQMLEDIQKTKTLLYIRNVLK